MANTKRVALEALEAFNAHDEARIRATYTKDVALEAPGDIRLEGADDVTGYTMAWLNAFPNAEMIVHDMVIGGDWVAQRFTFTGTHEDTLHGPAGDIPATHRRLAGRGVQICRIEGSKIAEEHLYFDQVQMMSQLGLMPELASARA